MSWLSALRDTLAGAVRAAADATATVATTAATSATGADAAVERHRLHGVAVEVVNGRPDIATADVLARLDEALALIARHQPWRLAHLRRDARAIRVERWPCRGAYRYADRAVITELTFLARRDIGPAVVATSVLHEGVHARVHAMARRFGARAPRTAAEAAERAAREERLCRRAEVAFGLALPPADGAPVVERARAALALDDAGVAPAVDWREGARRIAQVDGARDGRRA